MGSSRNRSLLITATLVAGLVSLGPPAAAGAADDLQQLSGTAGCLQEPTPNNTPDPTCATAFAGSLVGPERMQASADGKLVLAASPGALLVATRAANGTLTPAQCFTQSAAGSCAALRGLNIVNWIRFTPDDKHVYIGSGGGEIAVLDRNLTTNLLSQPAGTSGCYTTVTSASCTKLDVRVPSRDAAFTPDGSNLYIAADSGVSVLSRNTTSGALSSVQCVVDTSSGEDCLKVDNFVGATSAVVLPDASRVIVGLSNSNTGDFAHGGVWSFTRGANGTLTLGSCLQESATAQCAAATGVRNAQSLVADPDGTVYESGGAGDVGGVLVLDHSGSGHLTRLHCYAPAAVSGCENLLPDGVATPSAVALDGGFVHAVLGGSYVALTTHADHSLTIDSDAVRCFGAGGDDCPDGFRPAATALPTHITAVDGTSYLASESGDAVLAFKYPVAADLLDFTTAPKPAVKFGAHPVVGNILDADVGSWSPTPDAFKYTWRADGDPIPGEHGDSLQIPKSTKGKHISVSVTAVKSGYQQTTRTSNATVPVLGRFTDTPLPTISGITVVGQTLTAHASWTPAADKYTYSWIAGSRLISGEHKKTLKLTDALWGKRISVSVTGTKAGLDDLSEESKHTAEVVRPFTKAPTPTISGTAKVGHTLTAHHGTWQPAPAFAYQWFADGKSISGATHSTYAIKVSVKGKRLSVRVQGKKAGYRLTGKTSAPTAKVT